MLLSPFQITTADLAARAVRPRRDDIGAPYRLLPAQAPALCRSQPSSVHALGSPLRVTVDQNCVPVLSSGLGGGTTRAPRVAEGLVRPPRRAAAAVRRQVQVRRRRAICSKAAAASSRSRSVTSGGSVVDAGAMGDGIKFTRFNGNRATGKLITATGPTTATIHGINGGENPLAWPTV